MYCSHAVSQQIVIWICTRDYNSLSAMCWILLLVHVLKCMLHSPQHSLHEICVKLFCYVNSIRKGFTFSSRNLPFQQRTQILWFGMYSLHHFLRSCTGVSWTTWKFWNTNICLLFPLSPNYVLFKKNISPGARSTVATNSLTTFSTGSCSSVWQTALLLFQLCA